MFFGCFCEFIWNFFWILSFSFCLIFLNSSLRFCLWIFEFKFYYFVWIFNFKLYDFLNLNVRKFSFLRKFFCFYKIFHALLWIFWLFCKTKCEKLRIANLESHSLLLWLKPLALAFSRLTTRWVQRENSQRPLA